MKKGLLLVAVGMITMLVLVLCFQGVRSADDQKYRLSKLFSGVAIPVENYVQPEYVTEPIFATPLGAFNAFEASIQYGDDDFKVVNGIGQSIEGFGDVWMTTKMSEMYRKKYGYLVGDCDCLAIDMCSWFIHSGFKAYVVIGTVTLYDVDNPASWGTFQHAWVKVYDPEAKQWCLAETVLQQQVDSLKEYTEATVNYKAFWQFNNTSHSWGPVASFMSKYPELSSQQIVALRSLYRGN